MALFIRTLWGRFAQWLFAMCEYSTPTVVCLIVALTLASEAQAQINDEINAGIQFDFSPPGARSLALAGAFTANPNDATAAYANPAGLVLLQQSQLYSEARYRGYKTTYPFSGSASGTPRGFGIDTDPNLADRSWDSSTTGISFLSYLHRPLVTSRNSAGSSVSVPSPWVFALYRQQFADFETELESQGPFIRQATGGVARSRLEALTGTLDLEIAITGFSVGRKVGRRGFSIGGSLAYYEFLLDAQTRRYLTVDPTSPVSQAYYNIVPFTDQNEIDRHEQHGRDAAVGLAVGVLWDLESNLNAIRKAKKTETPIRPLRIGFSYKQSVSFDFDYQFTWENRAVANALGDLNGDGLLDVGVSPNPNLADPGVERALSGRTSFETPDIATIGFYMLLKQRAEKEAVLGEDGEMGIVAGYRLAGSVDVTYVGFSHLKPKGNILFNVLENFNSCGDFASNGAPQNVPCRLDKENFDRFRVDNSLQIRVGLELEWNGSVYYRIGCWLDPDHKLYWDGPVDASPPRDRFVPRFRRGEDELHVTGGIGVRPLGFQIDLGVDSSHRSTVVSLSVGRGF